MNPKRKTHRRPWRARSNAEAIATYGLLCGADPSTEPLGDDDMTATATTSMQGIDASAIQVVNALKKNLRVMIVGGAPGVFRHIPHRDDRFVHYASTETTERTASRFSLAPSVGLVLMTKAVGINLNRQVWEACSAQGVPLVGPFNSAGGVDRVLARAFELIDVPPGPRPVEAKVVYDHGRPVAVEPTVQPTRPEPLLSNDELAILKVFEDVEAGIALAKETALEAVRRAQAAAAEAKAAHAESDRNVAAVNALAALKNLLATVPTGEPR